METFNQQNYLDQEQAMLDHVREDFKTHVSLQFTVIPLEKLIYNANILYRNGQTDLAQTVKTGVHDLIIELTTKLTNLEDKQAELRLSDRLEIVKKVTDLEKQARQAA